MKIKIKCQGSSTRKLEELEIIQGDLKELSKDNYQKLRRRIEKYGFDAPFFVWKNNILDGTQRKRVLQKMIQDGWEIEGGVVPVVDIKAKDLNDAKKRLMGYVSQFGKLTNDGLYEFIADIPDLDFEELDLPNFNIDKFVDGFINDNEVGIGDEDEVPEVPKVAITKEGDIWTLGEHRLLCGDSTKKEGVEKLMDGQKADMVFTDPPYNIDYGNIEHPKFKARNIANDNMSNTDFRAFCEDFAGNIKAFCEGLIYVWGHPGPDGRIIFSVLDELFHCSTTVIWNKDQFTLGRGKYQNKYEPCWFGWNKDGKNFTDDRTLTNVWDFDRPRSSELHPTMKPVELCTNAIGHSSPNKGLVLDLFLGSGSTLIACEKTGRKCFGMELDPLYCDVIIKRWEDFTGKKAERIEVDV